jgi:uncharacterized protein (TIGR03000 family)
MLRKMISYGGPLLLVGAVALATPGSSRAQHGGGHAGGGHAGGGHFGGGNFGGAHFGGGRVGGAQFGGFRGGFSRGGFRGERNRHGYYPRYGYGGYYPLYGSYPYSYGSYPYLGSDLGYYSGYDGSSGEPALSYSDDYASVTPSTVTYQSFYPPTAAEPDTSAHLTVNVPAGARVWFDGWATTSKGPVREFVTPSLKPGRYSYEVRGRWNENGHEVTQTRQVKVTPGAHVTVSFPVPPKTASKASATKKG